MWLLTRIKSLTVLVMHVPRSKLTVGLEYHFLIISKVNLFTHLGDFGFKNVRGGRDLKDHLVHLLYFTEEAIEIVVGFFLSQRHLSPQSVCPFTLEQPS